jgi:ABC-three component (ABC-3C) system Middle Component 6
MILPTKHLSLERSLLGVGADILTVLDRPKTISSIWADFQTLRGKSAQRIPYDWFVLALSMLYSIEALKMTQGLLEKQGDT